MSATNTTQQTVPFAAFIGIDWADQQHAICLHPAGSDRAEQSTLAHTPEALAEWIAKLRERFGSRPVAVAVEQRRGALLHALMGHEFLVLYPIHSTTLQNYRGAFVPSGAKDDRGDAFWSADLLRHHHAQLRPWKPDDMRAVNDLDYLTSEYDNYTDILQTEDGTISGNHAILPDHAVQKADGERMTAWLTWDKKTQYMKRCPTLWVDAARATAEKVLSEWPFIGRFVDVTTAELVSHEFLTPDRAAQRTRFSDGTECIVNFGEKPALVSLGGKDFLLPQNGWTVKGPRIEQSLSLVEEKPVIVIRAPGYFFSDRGGVPVTMASDGAGRLRITSPAATERVTVRPADVASDWRPATAALCQLDAQGQPLDVVSCHADELGRIEFGPLAQADSLLLVWGKGAQRADLRVAGMDLSHYDKTSKLNNPRVTATIANTGGANVTRVPVEFRVDGRVVRSDSVSVKGRARGKIAIEIDVTALDGVRRLEVVIDPAGKIAELSTANNRAARVVNFGADWFRWPHRKLLRVGVGGVSRLDRPVVTAFKLPADADPNSVRVARAGANGKPASAVPAQLDSGELCFIMPGPVRADESRRFVVLWRDKSETPGVFAPGGSCWHETQRTILTPFYEARFENGTLGFLAPRKDGVTGGSFLKNLVLSSRETGWGDEEGKVEEFTVERAGSVRTIIKVRKSLKADVSYEKRYTFYPHRFDVETSVNKPAGSLYNRAHYIERGAYLDDKGNTVVVDGHGDAEHIAGRNKDPKWYAVFAPDWAHTCVALTPFENVVHWDAGGSWGGTGFRSNSKQTSGVRLSYIIRDGAKDGSFGAEDYRRLTTPVTVTWE